MEHGYIYILENRAMPMLIKIGYTTRNPEDRAKELSRATGVPTNFTLKYAIYAQNIKFLESSIHDSLDKFRENKSKEFFKINVTKAILIIEKKVEELRLSSKQSTSGFNELNERYETIEILQDLKEKHPNCIKDEINSIRIYQTSVRCYLEITVNKSSGIFENSYVLIDQFIHRIDLGFIAEYDEGNTFNPDNSVYNNATIFIETMDYVSLGNCCSEILVGEN